MKMKRYVVLYCCQNDELDRKFLTPNQTEDSLRKGFRLDVNLPDSLCYGYFLVSVPLVSEEVRMKRREVGVHHVPPWATEGSYYHT